MLDDILDLFSRNRRSTAVRDRDDRYREDRPEDRDRGSRWDGDDDDDWSDRRHDRRSQRRDSFFDD